MTVVEIREAYASQQIAPESPAAKALGARIRAARRKLMLNVRQVGVALGVKPNTVYHWELGAIPPAASNLPRLAALLETSPDVLLGRPEPEYGAASEDLREAVEIFAEALGIPSTMIDAPITAWPPVAQQRLAAALRLASHPTLAGIRRLSALAGVKAGPLAALTAPRRRDLIDEILAATDAGFEAIERRLAASSLHRDRDRQS